MKRRDLERHLRECGAKLGREGGRHSIWVRGDRSVALPRHREIQPTLARAICRALEVEPPSGAR